MSSPYHHAECTGQCRPSGAFAGQVIHSCWITTHHLGRGLMLLGHIYERCRICGCEVRSGVFGRNAETGWYKLNYPAQLATGCDCTTADRVRARGMSEPDPEPPSFREVSDGKMHQLLKAHQDKEKP